MPTSPSTEHFIRIIHITGQQHAMAVCGGCAAELGPADDAVTEQRFVEHVAAMTADESSRP